MIISIAMATYNGEKYLEEQLDSFAHQSHLPDELIICDDGSTDETFDIISNFMKTSPFQVKFIKNEKNLGHVQNFAKAMSLCSGEIVFLSDQDDKWFPNKIESVMQVFHRNPKCWILVHDGELTDSQLVPSGQSKMSQIRRGYGSAESIATGALTAIKRDLLKYVLPIPSGIIAHDAWCHQLASTLPARRVVLEQTLQYIRRHDNNTSSWVVNSGGPISRFAVARAQAKSAPADDYTDRLKMNVGLMNTIHKIRSELTDLSDLRAIQRAEARLESERHAIYSRQTLVEVSSFKRKLYSSHMLLSGQYKYFNGIRSFLRDVTR